MSYPMSGANLRTKPKFIRLCTMLDIAPVLARGHLEFLWDSVADSGDPGIGDAAAIEAAAGWTGEPGKLCDALLNCGGGKAGFIEESPDNRGVYRLHDLLANSSDEQIRLWRRRLTRAQRGQTIQELLAQAKPSPSTAAAQPPQAAIPESKPQRTEAISHPHQVTAPPSVQAPPSPKPASTKCPVPDIPTLLEVKELLARYGFKGKPADFLSQYRPESLPPNADWKAAAVEWLRREAYGNGKEIDRLLSVVR